MKNIFFAFVKTVCAGLEVIATIAGVYLLAFWLMGCMFIHFMGVSGSMLLGERLNFISELDGLSSNALLWEKILFAAECVSWTVVLLSLFFFMFNKYYKEAKVNRC